MSILNRVRRLLDPSRPWVMPNDVEIENWAMNPAPGSLLRLEEAPQSAWDAESPYVPWLSLMGQADGASAGHADPFAPKAKPRDRDAISFTVATPWPAQYRYRYKTGGWGPWREGPVGEGLVLPAGAEGLEVRRAPGRVETPNVA